MYKKFLVSCLAKLLLLAIVFASPKFANASGEKIIFIPHDDRPISYLQTVEVIEKAGYEMILSPKDLLNGSDTMGEPDKLWKWFAENAPSAKSAVVASDSLLYGGLIPSRKHEVAQDVLNKRLAEFEKIRRDNPNLKIYVFDSLMRTPKTGFEGNIEEPKYYEKYGADIFRLSELNDKKEIFGLTVDEEKEIVALEKKIPADAMKDWFGRREKNLNATKKLMDLTKNGVIDYLILGRDDNAPLCQTHKENREILSYAEKNNLPKTKFQSMPRIDEFNILLLNRAINDITGEIPTVNVRYNQGKGGDIIPPFSDEKISASIEAAVIIAGGKIISEPDKADFVLLVNTDGEGKDRDYLADTPQDGKKFVPNLKPSADTKYFANLVEEYINKKYPIGIGDIKYANGADNALMEILRKKDLLFKLQAYSGWNTATNSTGFAIGTGMLAHKMTEDAKNKLLATRYADDWVYQANCRLNLNNETVKNFGDKTLIQNLQNKADWAENEATKLVNEFVEKNLPNKKIFHGLKIRLPWKRTFECKIIFNK